MCINEKVNQGPLYDINVWCNRSFKTKLHPIIGNIATLKHDPIDLMQYFCSEYTINLAMQVIIKL